LNGVALAGFGDLYNSLRDNFLDDVGLPHVVKRLAGALESLAHGVGSVGIKGAVLEKPKAVGHRSTFPIDSAAVAWARATVVTIRSAYPLFEIYPLVQPELNSFVGS
jgi:hypothetical protein